MIKEIGIFKRYTKKNKITSGTLFTATIPFETGNDEKERIVRVWVPKNYFKDEAISYPVIYMSDGQNLVDELTSAFGEWNMEEHVDSFIKKGYDGMIVVGVDCPKVPMHRTCELCPPIKPDKYDRDCNPYGNLYGEFIFHKVKPLVDQLFRTIPDKEHTGVGGSSMGGIMAFYLGCKYHELVGFSLCFSPAFMLYNLKTIKQTLKQWQPNVCDYGKFFLYVGGAEYEAIFVKSTMLVHQAMLKKGFKKEQVCLLYDSRMKHHESAWSYYAKEALAYLYFNE